MGIEAFASVIIGNQRPERPHQSTGKTIDRYQAESADHCGVGHQYAAADPETIRAPRAVPEGAHSTGAGTQSRVDARKSRRRDADAWQSTCVEALEKSISGCRVIDEPHPAQGVNAWIPGEHHIGRDVLPIDQQPDDHYEQSCGCTEAARREKQRRGILEDLVRPRSGGVHQARGPAAVPRTV